jgi:hypothetical protein
MFMKRRRKLVIWIALIVGLCGVPPAALIMMRRHRIHRPILLVGAVIKQDSDTKSQSPIADVHVSAENGLATSDSSSNFSGAFGLRLRPEVKRGQTITLTFRHPNFKPFDLKEVVSDKLYVVRMLPLHSEVEANINKTGILVSNVLVRYSTAITSTENIGSGVRTFQVVNAGNVPCTRHSPCSPDGKWTAQVGSAFLDAGEGNVFRNARVTCIAGPCPFTRIDSDHFPQGGRTISASVRDWSDTTTFLLQGDVFRSEVGEIVRQSSAVIFGRTMNFTLPPTAEGPSIVAEMNQSREVFALGPAAILSWADCNIRVEKNQAKDYRCELKAGYRFQ